MPQPNARGAPKRSAFGGWRWSVAILLPLLLLAVLGVRGIQQGRENTLHRESVTAAGVLERSAPRLEERVRELVAEARWLRAYPAVPEPAKSVEAEAAYHRAMAGPAEEMEGALEKIRSEHSDAVTSAGIPLRPLMAWARLQRCEESAKWVSLAEELARSAVEGFPSLLTGKLLESSTALLVERGVAANSMQRWQRRWEEDERVREALRRDVKGDVKRVRQWVRDGAESWWVEADEAGGWRVLHERELAEAWPNVSGEAVKLLPEAVSIAVSFDRHPLIPAEAGETLARHEAGLITLAAILTNPAELFREQRKQTIWLAALLSVALVGVLGGFIAMQRALVTERQLSQQKSDFVASVSHELRTPVSSMRLMLENLHAGAVVTEEARGEYLRLLGGECQRLSALIENVLDFARIENDRKIYQMAEADVGAMMRDALQLLQPQAAQRHQQLVAKLETIDPTPRIDALAIQQAVINLIDNAMKFSPTETTITVEARPSDARHWEISVTDQGPGIPASEQERIFERFYRIGDELRRETQGAGIGLAIVKHTVEAHGGRIEVRSEPGRGATFVMILPYTNTSD